MHSEAVEIPRRQFTLSFRESNRCGEFRCEVCGTSERFGTQNLCGAVHRTVDHLRSCVNRNPAAGTQRYGTLNENLDSDPIVIDAATGNSSFEAVPLENEAELAAILRQRLSAHATAADEETQIRSGTPRPYRVVRFEPPGTRTLMLAKYLLARVRERGLSVPKLADFTLDRGVPLRSVMVELHEIEESLNE